MTISGLEGNMAARVDGRCASAGKTIISTGYLKRGKYMEGASSLVLYWDEVVL